MLVRRFEEAGSAVSYEIYGYSGDLAFAPSPLPAPNTLPESVASLEDALRQGAALAGRPVEAFVDVTQGRSVEIDLISALRSRSLSPLRLGMPAEAVEAMLGVPEAVTCLSEGAVSWFYGSVHLSFEARRLVQFEVDKGVADFTSLRFASWFLRPKMTIDEVALALDARAVPHRRVTRYDLPMLELGEHEGPRFLFDFDEQQSTLHALYWLGA
ncbi:hypothetical protein [Polyangium sorediatum]|uniref:Uncharacterized protein n=1 Tax=Polyangium sorediatum TaxID=889274 RepID=A0ABT6P8L7_9BACT|nr:hypothetical protein [Polyangium sorediatum]MDI1436906.1 hypothetical protein [Polyangium sorediatum]